MGVICVGIKNLESEEAAVETCTTKRELYIFEGVDRPSSYSVQVWFYSFHQVRFFFKEEILNRGSIGRIWGLRSCPVFRSLELNEFFFPSCNPREKWLQFLQFNF